MIYNPIDNNPSELVGRINALEHRLELLGGVQQEQGSAIQGIIEDNTRDVEYVHQNNIRNGDFDFHRNNYLYATDFAGGTGEDANVSEEAAHIYVHPVDTAVETTGSITTGTAALTINTSDFVAGDNGVEIIVYGAGAAGANLVTTISGAPGSATTATLAANASTTVTNARVRFRLLVLKEDSTDVNADANLATNTTLKTSAHTRYASTANNPDFDRANGWARWSEAGNMMTFPLAYNTVSPSKQYILTFIYKLANPVDGENEVFVDFFSGIWDNSSGRRGLLEGTQPSLSVTQQGTTGATTREYVVYMYMGDGTTVATERVTITDSNATLSTTNYVELSWTQEAGTVRSEVYRNDSGTYYRVAFPYPASTFYDTGQTLNTVGGFPTQTRDRFIAKAQATEANFEPASALEWRVGQMNIPVPSSYDKSKTTDKQWLVFGFNTDITGTDSTRALLVDLISLDDKYGVFSRCPLDYQAARGVTTVPTSGTQGTTGGGDPPIPPGGGGYCPVFTDLIETDQGPIRAIDLVDNEHLYQIKNRLGHFVDYKAQVVPPQQVYSLIAGEYRITASKLHPVFTSETDIVGKPLYRFVKGDIIDTLSGCVKVDALIKHFSPRHTVHISLDGDEKGFFQNGVAVHNRKEDEYFRYYQV